jgi:hypothetical protein
MVKRVKIIGLYTVSLIVFWLVISLFLPPSLKAESKSKAWEAVYTVDNSLKNTWAGELRWENREGKILEIHFIENGETISEMNSEDQVDMSKSNRYEFAYLGSKPSNKSKYQIFIRWEENGKEHEETVEFKPVKRYFVVPKLS